MVEPPARYCSNCGNELHPEDQFCQNCGTPVHQGATVPTPEADVPVPPPPPPQQPGGSAPPPQQAAGAQQAWPRRHPFLTGCLVLLVLLLLLIIAIVAIVAFASGGGGGDQPAQKKEQPVAAPSKKEEQTTTAPVSDDTGDTSTVDMTDAQMAADPNGEQPTTVFSPKDTFYCVGHLENAPDDTKVTAVWIAADVKDIKPDSKITEYSAKGGSGLFRFQLSPNESWPDGKYEVDLYLNDEKEPTKALQFEVQ